MPRFAWYSQEQKQEENLPTAEDTLQVFWTHTHKLPQANPSTGSGPHAAMSWTTLRRWPIICLPLGCLMRFCFTLESRSSPSTCSLSIRKLDPKSGSSWPMWSRAGRILPWFELKFFYSIVLYCIYIIYIPVYTFCRVRRPFQFQQWMCLTRSANCRRFLNQNFMKISKSSPIPIIHRWFIALRGPK